MQTKEQIKNEGFEIKKSSAAAFFLISLITSACGQKADPYQACLTQKMTELKQSESHKGADDTSLAASAKKACLAAMPTVKEPTITGY